MLSLPMMHFSLLPSETSFAQPHPQGTKAFKLYHLNLKVKETTLCAIAKATIDFVSATMKKAKQIAFNMFMLMDRLVIVTSQSSGSSFARHRNLQSCRLKSLPMQHWSSLLAHALLLHALEPTWTPLMLLLCAHLHHQHLHHNNLGLGLQI